MYNCTSSTSTTMVRFAAIAMLGSALAAAADADRPNIVLFLTDDQDQMLGGSFPTIGDATPMPRTRELLVDQGTMLTNFFVRVETSPSPPRRAQPFQRACKRACAFQSSLCRPLRPLFRAIPRPTAMARPRSPLPPD